MTPLLHRVRGASLQELGQPAEAERAVRDALDAARSRMARHEIAFALAALIDGGMAEDDAEQDEWRAELAQLSEELGSTPGRGGAGTPCGRDGTTCGGAAMAAPRRGRLITAGHPPVTSDEDQPCALGSLAVVVNDSV